MKSMRFLASGVLFLMAVMTVLSCAPATPAATPVSTSPVTREGPGAGTWQQEWERTIAAAKKENVVRVASSMAPGVKNALAKGLKDKYGIDLDVLSARPADFVSKLRAERRAGIYTTDVLIAGLGTILSDMGPTGDLDSLDPVLLLPEVIDPNLWYEGRLRFVDKDHYYFAMAAFPKRPIAINTELVKPEEIKSYRDLLNPKFKGKILFGDPTIGGAANSLFSALAESLMNLDYLKELAKQDPSIHRDERLMVEWLARGKYAVLLGPKEDIMRELMAAGAPIMTMSPAEGTYLLTSGFGIYLLKNAGHPNAGKLFINWLLSKEGQTLLSKNALVQSARVDVPSDHLHPDDVRRPGERYIFVDTEEMTAKREDYKRVARDIWGHVLK